MGQDNLEPAASAPPEGGLPPGTFMTAERQVLAILFSVEELTSLRHKAPAALIVRPVVQHVRTRRIVPARAFVRLSDDDMETVDRATTVFASEFEPPIGQAKLPLILPQSFRTVAGRRGRAALTNITKGDSQALRKRLIVELTDLDRGTPSGRLAEVVGLLNAMCKGVFARLQPGRDAAGPIRDVRLQGVTLDGTDLPGSDSDAVAALLDFADQARGLAPLLVAQSLSDEGFTDVAEVAGFTHVSQREQLSPDAAEIAA